MNEDTKAAFAAVNERLDSMDTQFDALMTRMNEGFAQVLDSVAAIRAIVAAGLGEIKQAET